MSKKYESEARSRWGNIDAYHEYEQKTKNYSKDRCAEANDGLMAIFAEFAECKNAGLAPNAPEVQSLVGKLQDYITRNYYTCTDEILVGLGKMYVSDERFQESIDKYGEGTAEFASKAIAIFCQEK